MSNNNDVEELSSVNSEPEIPPKLIDLNNCNSDYWLVQLPPGLTKIIGDELEKRHDDNNFNEVTSFDLGIIEASNENVSLLDFHLDDTLVYSHEEGIGFRDCKLKLNKCLPPKEDYHIISETHNNNEEQESQIAWEGYAKWKGRIRPEDSDNYRNVLRERQRKTLPSVRINPTKLITKEESLGFSNKSASDYEVKLEALPKKRKRKEITAGQQYGTLTKPQLENLLIELFNTEPYWKLSELKSKTGQKDKDLKAVLDEICTYSDGVNGKRHHYELKEKYK